MHLKRFLSIITFILLPSIFFTQKFRILDVEYELQKTKASAVERNIEISTTKVFESFEEFHEYVEDIRKRFQNERVFEDSVITYRYDYENTSDNDINLIHLHVYAIDSKSLLILPYPKYTSSEGFSFKVKLKDANFLGLMNDLSADAYFAVKKYEDDEDLTYKAVGFNFSYSYPFSAGIFEAEWKNDFFAEYNIDKSECEFNAKTGISFKRPFEKYSIVLDISESVNRNFEYTSYDDEFYFNTDLTLSVPIRILEIKNWGILEWTPYIEYSINYDKSGINHDNMDLTSPNLSVGHKVETGRINWDGNFRNGLSTKIGHSVAYNFQRNEFNPKVYGEFSGFKATKYIGIATRMYAFKSRHSSENIGIRLRGIIDGQRYKNSNDRALKVSSAVVLNFDIPIHIVTTNWLLWREKIFGNESWITKHTNWFKYFDFELQLSPFIDIALTKNTATGKTLSPQDGWYAGGIEVLLYPAKWRSIVIRGSYGIDLGKKLFKDHIDTEWRKDISESEVYIGIGLHY